MNQPTSSLIDPMQESDRYLTMCGRFEIVAAAVPERVALQAGEVCLTYRQVNQQANRLAHAILQQQGPGNQPVALMLPHSPLAPIAMLAVMKAGKCYVPVDLHYPHAWLNHILTELHTDLVLTDASLENLARAALPLDSQITLLRVDALDPHLPDDNPNLPTTSEDLAYILYTSGSTGLPKGAMHTHLDVMSNLLSQTQDLQITGDDYSGVAVTFGFEPSRMALYGPLLNGGAASLYDLRNQGLNGLAQWIATAHLSVCIFTPSTFRHMLRLAPDPANFASLRLLILGGEAVTGQDAVLFNTFMPPGSQLVNTLGMTETGILTRYKHQHGTPISDLSLPAGQTTGDKCLLLLNEHGQPVPDGDVGELYITSRYLIPGYWQRPDLTAERLSPDPDDPQRRRFRTGDLGRLRPDGMLEYMGRKDSQIKIRGFRVDPAEVEGVLQGYPGIRSAAVIAREVKDSEDEKQLVGYVEKNAGAEFTRQAIQQYLRERLPAYMVPPVIVFIEQLPLSPTGKINRAALPEPETLEQEQTQPKYIAASDAIELRLVEIWQKVLKVRQVGVQDDYFELGGNSLLAAQLFAAIEKAFGRKIPLASLFQAPTIAAQAAILRSETWTPDWSSLVALRLPDERLPGEQLQNRQLPLFFAAPVGGNVLSYHDLIEHLTPGRPIYGLQALGLDGSRIHRNVPEIAEHYLSEMLKVQPKGPYYLLGSSFGGLVAYEMAQRLHDMGQPVGLVVMFDSYGPNYPRRKPGNTRLRRKFFKVLRQLDTHLSNLRYTDWSGRVSYVRVKLPRLVGRITRTVQRKLDVLLHPLPPELRQVQRVHMRAAKRKQRHIREARRFGGRLVLFRAAKQPLGIYPDPLLGWGSVVNEQIEVHEIPGHHTSIIYVPRVPVLAEKLNIILNE